MRNWKASSFYSKLFTWNPAGGRMAAAFGGETFEKALMGNPWMDSELQREGEEKRGETFDQGQQEMLEPDLSTLSKARLVSPELRVFFCPSCSWACSSTAKLLRLLLQNIHIYEMQLMPSHCSLQTGEIGERATRWEMQLGSTQNDPNFSFSCSPEKRNPKAPSWTWIKFSPVENLRHKTLQR